jgi:hypothetical protein
MSAWLLCLFVVVCLWLFGNHIMVAQHVIRLGGRRSKDSYVISLGIKEKIRNKYFKLYDNTILANPI